MNAEAFAAAKVNLTLHVTGRRSDGYHLLDSLVAFADMGDRVTVTPAADWLLEVTGPMAEGVPKGAANLCLRAARMTEGSPAAIRLDKCLPAASGIGGGSADAAAVLRALHALDGRPVPERPERLGADLPVCLRSRTTRLRGIGERLDETRPLPPLHVCLVNPGLPVSTPEVFAALGSADNAPMPDPPEWRSAVECGNWLARQRNDLEGPARLIAPAIGVALSLIAATPACLLARMSGSGATCFGLYASLPEARAAAAEIGAARPAWWVTPASLR